MCKKIKSLIPLPSASDNLVHILQLRTFHSHLRRHFVDAIRGIQGNCCLYRTHQERNFNAKPEIRKGKTNYSETPSVSSISKRRSPGRATGYVFCRPKMEAVVWGDAATGTMTEKVWREYVSVLCQSLAKRHTKVPETWGRTDYFWAKVKRTPHTLHNKFDGWNE